MEVKKIWFENEKIFILTTENEELWQSLLWYPRLLNASDTQRSSYRITAFGLRWDSLDEDVSFESFTYAQREPQTVIGVTMKSLPEINVSQLARRMGISQSVFASYISGVKKPSLERRKKIEEALHQLGRELMNITL